MNKYDYITATTLEEKVRLEKLIKYMEDNNIEDNLLEYKERYNNICKYLVAKDKYLNIEKDIDDIKIKLDELYKKKDEYEVDNLLLEETLISKFNTDTNGKYRNILYEDIKLIDDKEIRDILYILFEKESEYSKLLSKRNKLKNIIDRDTVNVHSDYRVYATELINLLSIIISTRVKNLFVKTELSQKYSYNQIFKMLSKYKKAKIEDNGIWRSVTMLKYIEDVVGQLDV